MKSDPFPHLPPHTQKSSSGELSKYERKIKTVVFRKQEWKISSPELDRKSTRLNSSH